VKEHVSTTRFSGYDYGYARVRGYVHDHGYDHDRYRGCGHFRGHGCAHGRGNGSGNGWPVLLLAMGSRPEHWLRANRQCGGRPTALPSVRIPVDR
jgi:hypothetical protein